MYFIRCIIIKNAFLLVIGVRDRILNNNKYNRSQTNDSYSTNFQDIKIISKSFDSLDISLPKNINTYICIL